MGLLLAPMPGGIILEAEKLPAKNTKFEKLINQMITRIQIIQTKH